ncbi:MAG: CAP domain-containing protein, partial [Blastocatellia bacterium]
GHGVYVQNDAGTKRVADNVIFDQYGYGIHAYTENGSIKGFDFDGNTIFGSGSLAIPAGAYSPNILVGGFKPAERVTLTNNHLYHPLNGAVYNCQLFYVAKDNKDVTLRNNYIAGGSITLHVHEWQSVTAIGNTFIGAVYLASVMPAAGYQPSAYVWNNNNYISLNKAPAYTPFAFALNGNWVGHQFDSWRKATGFDRDGNYQQPPSGRPLGVKVFVRPNRYEAGRANITVYNWDLKKQIAVDVSGALRNGDRFEIRDARDFYGAPVLSGVYDDKPLSLPMSGSQPAPEFGAFVLMKLSGSSAEPIPPSAAPIIRKPIPKPVSTPTPTPTPAPTPIEPAPTPLDSEEQKLLDLINNYRFERGLSPLGASISLTNASHWHSRDMSQRNYLNPIDSLGRAPAKRARDFGFPGEMAPVEENALVAVNHLSFQQVFDTWRSIATDNSTLLKP